MSTADPDRSRREQLVRVQVTETLEQLNSRGPMTAAAFEFFAADNSRCKLLQGRVVEVLSPTDRASETKEETQAWIGAGVRCVINVHAVDRTATVYRGSGDPQKYRTADRIDLSDVVDEWQTAVETFFG